MGVSKQITYNTIGSIVTLFCQWLIMMIIPKITDFSEAGVFAVALSICSILNIFATFSLNQHQISDQYSKYTENDYRIARLATIMFSFVLCLAVIFLFDYSLEQNLVILFYMVYRNLLHYAYLYTATLQIRERLDLVGKGMIIEGIISFISFITSYYLSHDLVLSVAVMAVLGGSAFLIIMSRDYRKTVSKRYPRQMADRSAVSSLIKIGVPLLFSVVAPIIITALPKILLQAVDGDEAVGIFGTLSAPTIVIPTLVISIFAPFIVYFSNVARRGEMALIRGQYMKMVGLTLLFGLVCYTLSRLMGGFVFEHIYGPDIVPYTGYFDVLIVGIIFYSIGMWGITVMITKEQGRAAAIASVVSSIISIAILLIVVPEYGIGGATYGLMASYGVFGLITSLCVLFIPLTNAVKLNKNIQT